MKKQKQLAPMKAPFSSRHKCRTYQPSACSQLGRILRQAKAALAVGYSTADKSRADLAFQKADTLTKRAFELFPDFEGYSRRALQSALVLAFHLDANDKGHRVGSIVSTLEDGEE